jgi:hypothetical protein
VQANKIRRRCPAAGRTAVCPPWSGAAPQGGAFFADDAAADFNNDATIDSRDFFDFLSAFFAGCG